jgi:hypothetical protein
MRTAHRVAVVAAGLVLLLAPMARAQSAQADHGAPDTLVDAVRSATRQYLDVNATAGGNYFPVLGCISGGPDAGAMGVHYLNGSYLMDKGKVEADKPEALIYEFNEGKATLTAVEYIVIAADWDPAPDPQHPKAAPALMGQLFSYTGFPNRFGLPAFYSLHVWAWKDNPSGTFVDWNPKVGCDHFATP